MLGFYNTNYNNSYMNQNQNYGYGMQQQNYGYGQSVMNPYQQQTSLFGGYQTGYQQQPVSDTNSMLFSMLNSLLPLMMGLFSNRQAVQQQPVVSTVPASNTISNSITGNSGQNNIYNIIINLLLNSAKEEKTPVEIDEETINVITNSGGDPHFYIGDHLGGKTNKLAYDFQGEHKKVYSLLDNSDISVKARFLDANSAEAIALKVNNSDVARIMGDMDVDIKGTGINIIGHNDKNFEIYENGQKIADQSNYKDIEDKLKAKNITIEPAKNKFGFVTIQYGERTIELCRSHGGMWLGANRMIGDKGLNEQAYGALDKDSDGNTQGIIDTNNDGKVDDKDNLKYNLVNQVMVNGTGSADAITPEIEAAIKKDIEAGIKLGSAVKGYSAEHGYSAMQWNEYVGARVFTATDELLTAK